MNYLFYLQLFLGFYLVNSRRTTTFAIANQENMYP